MELKEVKVEEKNSFVFLTSIWIVPIVALIIALWLVYDHYSKVGPLIKIEFKESGGLVAGQSVVKFRDVPVGKVEKIEINEDKDGVIVYAKMNKDVEPFLNETTKFWIVKPEVSYSGVQGLETILSGTYIKMYAKKGKRFKKEFIGLDHPYIDTTDVVFYSLFSTFPVKIKEATPVYFKGYKVGEVDNVKLNLNSKNLDIKLKIFKKYEELINETTKFWVQSLINLKLNDNRLDVEVAPLPTILLGGIEFSTKFDRKYMKDYNKTYRLYKDKFEAKRNNLKYIKPIYQNVMFNFSGDISSIDIGMSIKYKGIKLGEVDKIDIYYEDTNKSFKALCLGKIDISNFGSTKKKAQKNFLELLNSGLIAKLQKSLIFNKSNIVLEIEKNSIKDVIVYNNKYNAYEIRSKGMEDEDIIAQINQILDRFKKIDFTKSLEELDKLLKDVRVVAKNTNKVLKTTNKVLKSADKTLATLNRAIKNSNIKSVSKNLNKSLIELQKTLKQTRKTLKNYGENSLFIDKIDATLQELHNATTQTTKLLNKLNKKPNALIFGD